MFFFLLAAQLIIFRRKLIVNAVAKFGSRSLVKVMGETVQKMRTISANKVIWTESLVSVENGQVKNNTNNNIYHIYVTLDGI